jgi:hypothetical protein
VAIPSPEAITALTTLSQAGTVLVWGPASLHADRRQRHRHDAMDRAQLRQGSLLARRLSLG